MDVKELDPEKIQLLTEILINPVKKITKFLINTDASAEITFVIEYEKGGKTQSAII